MTDACPGARCFELLGKKWTAHIVWALLDGPLRFTELADAAPGLRDRVLSHRLKEMMAAGVVTRSSYPEAPPRVEYALTDRGRALRPVIQAMERWGRRWVPAPPAQARSAMSSARSARRTVDARM